MNKTVLATLLIGSLITNSVFIQASDQVDYTRDVLPIFQAHCIGCHAEDDDQGGLVIESFEQLMIGGDHGTAITPGSPLSSRLLLMSSGKLEPKMPPDDAEGPNETELAMISAWIEQGAKGPGNAEPPMRALRFPAIPPMPGVSHPVTSIAATADGRTIATARYGEIQIADRDGQVLRTIAPIAGKVNSLEFSRDGASLLVGSGVTGASGTAMIYSVESGSLVKEFVGHRDSVFTATFSPDETRIVTGGYDRGILLWNVASGEVEREFTGHNGAITDLVFSPSGKVICSSSSDGTVKVWNVSNGHRLDTLSQSEGEVLTVDVTPDGKFVIAGSADNRIRVWRLVSVDKPSINPLVATRFMDESPIAHVSITPDSSMVLVLSEAGRIKIVGTDQWQQIASLAPLGDIPSDACLIRRDKGMDFELLVSLMNGATDSRTLPTTQPATPSPSSQAEDVYLDLGPLHPVDEANSLVTMSATGTDIEVPRGAQITGVISEPGEQDRYRFTARRGEVWAIDADAIAASRIDPVVKVLDAAGHPVLRTRLQAVRNSYFTFRGKDSMQSSDFRVFAWQEMHLNDYLYAAGEVTRLWMHPRGPDSGFNVYPGTGDRWTYFGTSHLVHALGEPAYVVQPLGADEQPSANGLPVFDVYYENDDDPTRLAGKNSRLLFKAPSDSSYTVVIADTRGEGGVGEGGVVDGNQGYGYQLKIRPAQPSFTASLVPISQPIRQGTGRECVVKVDRADGYDGEVTFEVAGLPAGVKSTFPVIIQSGQREAIANVWADLDCPAWEATIEPTVTASAEILGRRVQRDVGSIGKLSLAEAPRAIPRIIPSDGVPTGDVAADSSSEPWTLQIARGETVTARVTVTRESGFDDEIGFGKEFAGRNTAHGVYVDNIGLSGLLLLAGETQREFFIAADPIAELGKREFFLQAEIDGGVTTPPIVIEVLP